MHWSSWCCAPWRSCTPCSAQQKGPCSRRVLVHERCLQATQCCFGFNCCGQARRSALSTGGALHLPNVCKCQLYCWLFAALYHMGGHLQSWHCCPCVLPQLKTSLQNSEVVIAPPVKEVTKLLSAYIKNVAESCREFVRWMDGTCLEMPDQRAKGDTDGDPVVMHFSSEVLRMQQVRSIHTSKGLSLGRGTIGSACCSGCTDPHSASQQP
eukprot:GHRQ01020115.1.p1 GENE.GHRQ01020115.1~~GHRQ01020115.1.p1  ORF type:complete len:210 (-),score=29.59 GHRQ01020115.1:450-1079(-)